MLSTILLWLKIHSKLQLNICYISSSLIQIIKFPDEIMKKCISTINNLQFMYFVVNYFVPYDKWSGIHPCTGEHYMFCTHKQSPFSTKNSNLVEDHPRNIPAKLGSNWPTGFEEEAWNVKSLQTTDNRRQAMAIVHLDLWLYLFLL
jgi:hypothetical protein